MEKQFAIRVSFLAVLAYVIGCVVNASFFITEWHVISRIFICLAFLLALVINYIDIRN